MHNNWLVGKTTNAEGTEWEFQGIFDNVDVAVSQCKNENYFVGPVILNEVVPDVTRTWPGAWYPKNNTKPLWVVCDHSGSTDNTYKVSALYDNEFDAINACINLNYFIGPIYLNAPDHWPDEEWPGSYYPSK